jgi:allantoinase
MAYRVFTGRNVLLPDVDEPIPATILVNEHGEITDVLSSTCLKSDYPHVSGDRFVDAGEKYLLPGLVEYVSISFKQAVNATEIRVKLAHTST